MRNILIIGGRGFIGRNIIEALADDETKIFVLIRDKRNTGFDDIPQITIIQGDLSRLPVIKKVIKTFNISIVFHLASNLIPSSGLRAFNDELENVVLPTFSLLSFIAERKIKIIFFSSGGTIYGKAGGQVSETARLEPTNFYGHTKLLIENHIQFLNRTKGLRFIILRPSNVYGKYQKLNGDQGFIAVAVGRIMSQQPIEIWGDGSVVRDYVNVADVALTVKRIIEKDIDNGVFNIGTGKGHDLLEVIQCIEGCLQLPAKLVFKGSREVDVTKLTLDVRRLGACLTYDPVELKDGISRFVNDLKDGLK